MVDPELVRQANEWHRDSLNKVFEKFDIPARIKPISQGEQKTSWEVTYLNGSNATEVLKLIYAKQDIVAKKGPLNASQDEALFMAMSQFFDWILAGGSVKDPGYPQVRAVMFFWTNIFRMKGGTA